MVIIIIPENGSRRYRSPPPPPLRLLTFVLEECQCTLFDRHDYVWQKEDVNILKYQGLGKESSEDQKTETSAVKEKSGYQTACHSEERN